MPMIIVKIIKLEDCFDGSYIYKYEFSKAVDEKVMNAIAEGERLQYFPMFSKPFYKIYTREGLQIKGILGEYDLEVTFPITDQLEKKKLFEEFIRLQISRH